MTDPKNGASLEHQGRPTERLPGVVEEFQFGLRIEPARVAWHRLKLRYILYRESELCDVILYQDFSSRIGMIEQPWEGDIGQVPDQSRSDNVDDIEDIVVFLGTYKSLQPSKDETVIVVSARWSLAPERQIAQKGENGFSKNPFPTDSVNTR